MDLPSEGLRGNTHMPMMDINSDEIAARIQDWIGRNNLMKNGPVAAGAPAKKASARQSLPSQRRSAVQ
jgi:hypothetical protein